MALNGVPQTVKEVFEDFKGRRTGLIKALTTEAEEFHQQCDPEKGDLCLYGYPNKQWKVILPAEVLPTDLPEPALGINLVRDDLSKKGWLIMVAARSDAWLLSVAVYLGSRRGFKMDDREKLFSMINKIPTIFEVVKKRHVELVTEAGLH